MILPTRRPLLQRALLTSACALALLGGGAGPGPCGAAFAQEGAAAVQDVVLENLALRFGDTAVTAARVTVSGTRRTREELLAIVAAESKESWGARLQRLDAGSITIPELRITRAGAEPGPERGAEKRHVVVYRDVVARGLGGGRVAEMTASGATLAVEAEPPAKSGGGSYGRIRAEEVDLAALARLYAEPGDANSPFRRLYGTVSVSDVAFTDDRGTVVTLARIVGRDFSGRPIPATWSGALGALAALDPNRADPGRQPRAAGLAADLVEAVSVGSLDVTGLAVKESGGRDPLTLGIGALAYAGTGPQAGLTLEDISFVSLAASGKIGRVGLTGFSLAPTVEALRRIAGSADAGEGAEADLRRLTPLLGTVSLKDLGIDLHAAAEGGAPDPAVAVTPAPTHIGLRGAAMTFGPPKDGVPTASRLDLSGLTLPASAVTGVPGLGALALYGYRDLDLDLVADTAWDEGARELTLKEISLVGRDMGRLRLNARLGGIGPEVFDPDAAVSGLAMLSATAKGLDLTLENGGLFERFIAAQAKGLSLKPDELRREYVTASVIGVPVILGNTAAAKALGAAMGQFVAKPGRLSISAKAKNGEGLGMVDVSTAPTPAAVLDKLDVSAKAE